MRSRQPKKIGVYGISLGGNITALVSSLVSPLDCVITAIPMIDLTSAARDNEPWIFRRYEHEFEIDWEVIRAVSHVISPLSLTPPEPRERLFICAGTADRVVPPNHARALWRHWNRPEIHWFSGSHVLGMLHPSVAEFRREVGSLGGSRLKVGLRRRARALARLPVALARRRVCAASPRSRRSAPSVLQRQHEAVEIAHQVEVGVEAEEEPAVVAHHRDAEPVVLAQRHLAVGLEQARALEVEGHLRARRVGDHHVDGGVARLGARAEREQPRAEPGVALEQRARGQGPLAGGKGRGGLTNLVEARDHVLVPDRQVDDPLGHALVRGAPRRGPPASPRGSPARRDSRSARAGRRAPRRQWRPG